MKELGLEVETLEKSLHVSTPLGTRVSVDLICRDCELEISEILHTVDLSVMDMSEFDIILRMDWLTAHRVVLIAIVGELLHTHRTVFVLCFKEISMMLYPIPCTTPGGTES